jgi:hypothetical protein
MTRGVAVEVAVEEEAWCYEDEIPGLREAAMSGLPRYYSEYDPRAIAGYVYRELGHYEVSGDLSRGGWVPERKLESAKRGILRSGWYLFEPFTHLLRARGVDFPFVLQEAPPSFGLWGGGYKMVCRYCTADAKGQSRVYLRKVVVYVRPSAGARDLRILAAECGGYHYRLGAGEVSCGRCGAEFRWDESACRVI